MLGFHASVPHLTPRDPPQGSQTARAAADPRIPVAPRLPRPSSFQRGRQRHALCVSHTAQRHIGLVYKEGQLAPVAFSRSVFLLGAEGAEWENEAIDALVELGFSDGVIFVGGIDTNGSAWAVRARLVSDVVVCFVPSATSDHESRQIAWPALQWADSGKLVCGADSSGWLHEVLAVNTKMTLHPNLQQTMSTVWKMVAKGAMREAAEREVPLMVWRTPSWEAWYNNLKSAGNRLDGAKVNWTFRVGPGGAFVLFWAVHANIWVQSENRNKANEVVIARPDIACVLAYLPGLNMLDTEIVLIKEFRSPCRNQEMFVYELPGGSTFKPGVDTFQTAANELFEETGIRVSKDRLEKQINRQAAATVTTHHVHLFSCELTGPEMLAAKEAARSQETFGNYETETERTYIETMSLREAIPSPRMDFTTLGMIMQTIGIYFDHQNQAQLSELKGRLERLGLDTCGLQDVDEPTSPSDKLVAALGDSQSFRASSPHSRASVNTVATVEKMMSVLVKEQSKLDESGKNVSRLEDLVRSQQEEIEQLKAANSAQLKAPNSAVLQ